MLFVSSSAANNVTIGDCEIALDFEDKEIISTPLDTSLSGDIIIETTTLLESSTKAFGFIYIHDFPTEQPIDDIEGALESTMDLFCGRVSIESYSDGFIANGLFIKGAQMCWGVSLPIDNVDGKMTQVLTVIAAFKDADFNERLVKGVNIENLECG